MDKYWDGMPEDVTKLLDEAESNGRLERKEIIGSHGQLRTLFRILHKDGFSFSVLEVEEVEIVGEGIRRVPRMVPNGEWDALTN